MMDRFHKANLPSFEGQYESDVTLKWLQEIEKIFRGVMCPEDQQVHLGTFMLHKKLNIGGTATSSVWIRQ
jgi:hypothetical protein